MRKILITALAAAGVIASAAQAQSSAKPGLLLVSARPIVVRGTGFQRAERVRLTLRTEAEVLYRRAVASRLGTFRSDFGVVSYGRCGGFTIRAVGSKGSTVLLRKLPLPACMPERSP